MEFDRPYTVKLLDAGRRGYAKRLVDMAPEGWTVVVREPARSLEQNARFHAMIDDLVRQKPEGRNYDKDQWKAAVLKSLGKEVAFIQDLEGNVFPVGPRSSRLTVREMSDAMEIMAAYGAQNGVIFREPERS